MTQGIDPLTLDARRLLNLRYSMLFVPGMKPEQVEKIQWAFGWPPTREEWGATPEALAAQESMARQFPELDVDEE